MTLPSTLTIDEARAEIAGWIEAARAAWTAWTVQVVGPNRSQIDLASPEAEQPHIEWGIKWRPGGQMSLGAQPVARQFGQLVIAAKVKEGAGAADCLQLLASVVPFVEAKNGTYVSTQVGSIADEVHAQGWYMLPLVVNFWMDRIVP
jgi:hypothetical protein